MNDRRRWVHLGALVLFALVGEALAVMASRTIRPFLGAAGVDVAYPTTEPTRLILLAVALLATTAALAPVVHRIKPHRSWLFAAGVSLVGTATSTIPQAFELSAAVETAILGPVRSDLDLVVRLPVLAIIGGTATWFWMGAWDLFPWPGIRLLFGVSSETERERSSDIGAR